MYDCGRKAYSFVFVSLLGVWVLSVGSPTSVALQQSGEHYVCVDSNPGFWCELYVTIPRKSSIALNLRIKIFANSGFEYFNEMFFADLLPVLATHLIYYRRGIQAWPVYLTCTIPLAHCCFELAAVSKAMHAYFEDFSLDRVPCRFGSLATGYLSMLLRSEHENCVACQKFSLKYFCKRLKIRKICEIKDTQKI